jgi:hypothetical protein
MSINRVAPYRQWDYVSDNNPTVEVNPMTTGMTWLNLTSGEIFVCTTNTVGSNVWVGQKGTAVP